MSAEGHSRMEYARRKVGMVTAWSQTSVHRRGQRRTDDRWSASSSPPSDTKQAASGAAPSAFSGQLPQSEPGIPTTAMRGRGTSGPAWASSRRTGYALCAM
jgi:hypothetical protein